jgi:O-acetylhomoserine (thiol)-lyase
MSTQKFATNALHAGHDTAQNGGTRAVPIYQSTAYVFNDSDHAANLLLKPETFTLELTTLQTTFSNSV